MNDPALTNINPTMDESTTDVSRRWWQAAWHKLRCLLHSPPNAEALREVVEEILEEPLSESGVSVAERLLLSNIMNLRERTAGDCMVTRADIIACDVGNPLKELVDLMAAHAHSRIPVYRGTLDDVIGMVHIKDVIACLASQQMRAIADLLRPILFVAPSMSASKLLLQMRQTRQHMAVVVDEFGGIDGLVTIEDLMEEIVGEIEDEHDLPFGAPIVTRTDGTLLVDARLEIKNFEAKTGLSLSPLDGEDVDTLGGYVTSLAGRMPHIGESFANDKGLTFEVLELDQSCIKRLRIRNPLRAVSEAQKARAKAV